MKTNKKIKFDPQVITNLIVIGDALYEIEAGLSLSKSIEKCLIKTVKLSELPTAQELIKQLTILSHKWEYISSTYKNLTVKLERKSDTPGSLGIYSSTKKPMASRPGKHHRTMPLVSMN